MSKSIHPMHRPGIWSNGVFRPGKGEASHVTEISRKYQCNGPSEWLSKLLKLGDGHLSTGIRRALAKGLGDSEFATGAAPVTVRRSDGSDDRVPRKRGSGKGSKAKAKTAKRYKSKAAARDTNRKIDRARKARAAATAPVTTEVS